MPFRNEADRKAWEARRRQTAHRRLLQRGYDATYRRTEKRRRSWRSWAKRAWRNRRHRIHRRDRWRCHYCDRRCGWRQLTLDHIVPRCRGGTNADENLVSACRSCNLKKGTKPYEVFVERMRADRGAVPLWVEEEAAYAD